MIKSKLAENMLKLAYDLQDVAVDLDYYGGFSEWSECGRELMQTATLVKRIGSELLNDKT